MPVPDSLKVDAVCSTCGRTRRISKYEVTGLCQLCWARQPRAYQVRQLAGQKFNMLTALAEAGRDGNGGTVWLCRCDCGREKSIAGRHLVSGSTKSCGCHRARWSGLSRMREYKIWNHMMYRCSKAGKAAMKHYYDKGVKVCQEWYDFRTFLKDMGKVPGPGYSIDRIDTTGDYEPDNCRWATALEQQRNRRNHKLITINGVTKIQSEWCEEYGISHQCFQRRIKLGYSSEQALLMPKRNQVLRCRV